MFTAMSAGTRPPKSHVTMAVFFTVSPIGAMPALARAVCKVQRGGGTELTQFAAVAREAVRIII